MRRMSILLIPLIILLAASPALAPFHDFYIAGPVNIGGVLLSLFLVGVLVIVLAWSIVRFFGARRGPAIFVAGVSIPTMLVLGDYVFALLFGALHVAGFGQLVFLTVLDYVIIALLLVWSASWTLNTSMPTGKMFSAHVFRSVIGPVLLTSILAWFLHH